MPYWVYMIRNNESKAINSFHDEKTAREYAEKERNLWIMQGMKAPIYKCYYGRNLVFCIE